MEIVKMLFFFAGVQGIILSLILFFSKRHHKAANKFLATFIFLFSFNILRNHFSDYYSDFVKSYPIIYIVTWGGVSFFGPFLYLYVKKLIKPGVNWRNLVKKHFGIPLIYLIFLFYIGSIGITSEDQASDFPVQYYIYVVFQIFMVFQILTYLVLSIKLISRYHKEIRDQQSNIDKLQLNWLLILLLGLLIQYIFWVLVFGGDITIFKRGVPDYFLNVFRSVSAVFVYWIGYYVLLKPEIFVQENLVQLKTSVKSQNSLDELELEIHKKELIRLLEEDKIFLNPSLTINELAGHLKINSKVASQVVNTGFQKTFYELINFYRIEEVKHNLLNPQYKNYTIEAIAFSSGFKSTTTLNRLFKSYTKQTPNQYRNSHSR